MVTATAGQILQFRSYIDDPAVTTLFRFNTQGTGPDFDLNGLVTIVRIV